MKRSKTIAIIDWTALELTKSPIQISFISKLNLYIYHIFDHDIKNYIDIDMSIPNSYIHLHVEV
jgi:hypothetical protein